MDCIAYYNQSGTKWYRMVLRSKDSKKISNIKVLESSRTPFFEGLTTVSNPILGIYWQG